MSQSFEAAKSRTSLPDENIRLGFPPEDLRVEVWKAHLKATHSHLISHNFDEAFKASDRMLSLCLQGLPDRPDLQALSHFHIAIAANELGKTSLAEASLFLALEIYEDVIRKKDHTYYSIKETLSVLWIEQGRYEEKKADIIACHDDLLINHADETLEESSRLQYGACLLDLSQALSSYYFEVHDYETALYHLEVSLSLFESGVEHQPITKFSVNRFLAVACFRLSAFEEAAEYAQKALDLYDTVADKVDPNIKLFVTHLLVSSFEKLEHDAGVFEYVQDLLAESIPSRNPEVRAMTVSVFRILSETLYRLEDFGGALSVATDGLEFVKESRQSPEPAVRNDSELTTLLTFIGKSYFKLGMQEKAFDAFEDAISLLREMEGNDRGLELVLSRQVRDFYQEEEQSGYAITWANRSVRIGELLDTNLSTRAMDLLGLADAYMIHSQVSEFKETLDKVKTIRQELRDLSNDETKVDLSPLVLFKYFDRLSVLNQRLYQQKLPPSEFREERREAKLNKKSALRLAIKFQKVALKYGRECFGTNSIELAEIYSDLALLCETNKDFDGYKRHLRSALRIAESAEEPFAKEVCVNIWYQHAVRCLKHHDLTEMKTAKRFINQALKALREVEPRGGKLTSMVRSCNAEYYWELAIDDSTNFTKRQELLDRAVSEGRLSLELARKHCPKSTLEYESLEVMATILKDAGYEEEALEVKEQANNLRKLLSHTEESFGHLYGRSDD